MLSWSAEDLHCSVCSMLLPLFCFTGGFWMSGTNIHTGEWQWYNSITGTYTSIDTSVSRIHDRRRREGEVSC